MSMPLCRERESRKIVGSGMTFYFQVKLNKTPQDSVPELLEG